MVRWHRSRIGFFMVVLLLLLATIYYANLQRQVVQGRNTKNHKVILAWTNFFQNPMSHDYYFSTCPHAPCRLTSNRTFVDKASALVFHGRTGDFSLGDLPKSRSLVQRYVFFVHENPMYESAAGLAPRNFFNWTMTYRLDSDVPYPYKFIVRREKKRLTYTPALREMWMSIVKNKTKLAVWLVSNCNSQSKREKYVEELQKYVNVDVIGACGEDEEMAKSCPKREFGKCEAMIEQKYKFYIAFENAICKDYITEKYWGRWRLFSVPIVLKRSIYENLVPNNSFVAIDDFGSPQELAEYLKLLDKDHSRYLEYFAWRTLGYENVWNTPGYNFGFCKLCEMLWRNEPRKSYDDLDEWWLTGSYCDAGEYVKKLIGQ